MFHLTAPLKARVSTENRHFRCYRLYLRGWEDGSFGGSPKPYHEEAAEFDLASDTENDYYVPCGHVYDKATCTIFNVFLNHDVPPLFLAYI